MTSPENPVSRVPAWGKLPAGVPSMLRDLPIIFAGLASFYALLSLTHYWIAPVSTRPEIQLSLGALPKYAMFSLLRIMLAYFVSLIFTLIYGYVAAYNAKAERFLIPLLDTLQSIPVLSFLPGVMLAMVALFPTRQFGIELGSILLIFTGQVWNMTFSFYSSLKSIPREMREVAEIYRWSWWQRFVQMELPFATIGLVWNSMMSVAGGWFFLMACEMFVLQNRDLRLAGLGSYLQTAANAGDTRAIIWGVVTMVGVIVLMDQLIWRPIIAWAEKFKFEQVEAIESPHSYVLDFLRRSKIVPLVAQVSVRPMRERLSLYFARGASQEREGGAAGKVRKMIGRVVLTLLVLGIGYEFIRMTALLVTVSGRGNPQHFCGSWGDVSARGVHAGSRGAVDDSGWSHHWVESAALGGDAADRADRGFRACDGAFSDHSAFADSRGRRVGDWVDRAAFAGDAVVHPFQCDCRGFGDSIGLERSVRDIPVREVGEVAGAFFAGDFSLFGHRVGYGFGRGLECEHCGGIFSFSRADVFDCWAWGGDQQRDG